MLTRVMTFFLLAGFAVVLSVASVGALGNEAFAVCFLALLALAIVAFGAIRNVPFLVCSLLLALVVRIVVAIVDVYFGNLPYTSADVLVFKFVALQHMDAWNNGQVPFEFSGWRLWASIIGLSYYLFGVSEFFPRALNIMFSLLTIVGIHHLSKELGRSPKLPVIAYAIHPVASVFSVILLRESLFVCVFVWGTLLVVRFINSRQPLVGLSSLLPLFIATSLNSGGVAGFAGFLGGLSLKRRGKWLHFLLVCMVLLVLFVASPIVLTKFDLETLSPEEIISVQERKSRGGSAYQHAVTSNSWFGLIAGAPISILHFVLGPPAWRVRGMSDILAALDGAFLGYLLFASFRRLSAGSRKTAAVAVLWVICLGIVLFSLGTSNYGTALRHRHKFLALLLCTGAAPIQAAPNRCKQEAEGTPSV